ncbi:MAG: DDE-type integrase/transposase/recombinase [Anaerolineales bacterium]|nr:DDE-type integrase/transposase/recombinase [Anaerolineales bacterium]
MRKKHLNQWIMYHEVQRQHREGLKPAQIARELVMDRRTVKKYLAMSEEEYEDFIDNQTRRQRVLTTYENYVRTRLEHCPEASSAQVHDWLKEHHDDFIEVDDKTVFNFVLHVRSKYGIPKSFDHRDYEKVPELPYGQQTQVDFGEYNMTTDEGGRKRIHYISFVLSRSRMKYCYYSDRPFTTRKVIMAHEAAIVFFGGMTREFVYDQDTLLLVAENHGDLIMTDAFRSYAQYRGFQLYFCRKSDPQSKGKVENVVKYVKYNFLRGRIFIDVEILQGESLAWLNRTANAKEHSTTKKIPFEEWLIEREYLQPVTGSFEVERVKDEHNVRKDNIVSYKGNFYRVPRGTYHPPKTKVHLEHTEENRLIIFNTEGKVIATHAIYPGAGETVGGSNYKRELEERIDELIDGISNQFKDPVLVKQYCLQIRKDKPRYIRDQMGIIKRLLKNYPLEIVEQAVVFCAESKIYRTKDLESVVKRDYQKQSQEDRLEQPVIIKTINQTAHRIIPDKSDISDYQSLMN